MILDRFKSFAAAEKGVAAIETALIMPFLLLLYFGMIDLTQLISLNRKITYSASVVADATSQNRTTVTSTTISDYYKGVELIMSPTPISSVNVNLYGYRLVSGTPTQIWKTSKGSGPTCSTTPQTGSMAALMTAGNDLIIAITCMNYTPYVANFIGEEVLGDTSFALEQTVMLRPRSTLTLECRVGSSTGALCT